MALSWKHCMDLVEVNLILARMAWKDGDKFWHQNYIALADHYLRKLAECDTPNDQEQQEYIVAKASLQAAEAKIAA